MTKINNASLLIRAADAAILGDDVSSGALAMGLIGAMETAYAPLVAVLGDDRFPFVAADYLRKPRKLDGKVDAKLHSARSAAMMVDLYGQASENIAPAVQTLRDKTFAAGVYAECAGLKLKLVKVTGRSGKARHCVEGVPAGVVLKLFDDNNKPTSAYDKAAGVLKSALTVTNKGKTPSDADIRNAVLGFPLVCDGADHPMFGVKVPTTGQLCSILKGKAASAGLSDPIEGRASRTADGDGGDKLLEHATAIKTALDVFLAPEGESDKAPSRDFEAAMDVVAERWAAYRVANPVLF